MAEADENEPRVLDVLAGEAEEFRKTPYGTIGVLHAGPGIRAEWVSKRAEAIDPGWSSRDVVDLVYVVAGELRVEFEGEGARPRTVRAGQFLILPSGVRYRACSWPRGTARAAVFLAVRPADQGAGSGENRVAG